MRYLPLILSCLMLAAHHLRAGQPGLLGLWLTLPLILLMRRRWADLILQLSLVAGAGLWVQSTARFVHVRQMLGLPYGRLMLILGGVALFTLWSGWLLNSRGRRARLPQEDPVAPGLTSGLLAISLLIPVQLVMDPPGLLAERFLPAAGWWEAVALGIYAGWLSDRLRDPRRIKKLRPRVWFAFSVIFFTQFILGLAGIDRMLMTGKLHLPVPALIAAGPIFRGSGFFMAILFSASILVVGPAWCSWLCYIGAWDDRAARARKRPGKLPAWRPGMRVAILLVVLAVAFGLGRLGTPVATAGMLAAGFGLIGVGLMVWWSRRTGHMTHCTAYCPMGWFATRLGKVSPWRLRITPACTDCGACTPACRYDALYPEDVARRHPGEACTLCGDCLSHCPTGSLTLQAPLLSPTRVRIIFFSLVCALHAVWIGVARL